MTLPPPKICQRMRALHSMVGSPNTKEAQTARDKLLKLLTEHGLSWNDLPAIIATTAAAENSGSRAGAAASGAAATSEADLGIPGNDLLGLILGLIEEHVAITAEECMAVALRLLHTWVFDRFPITPRLALLSPVDGCGKTTLLVLIELLVAEAYRTDNITPAALYHQLDSRPRTTLLADEGDNLGLLSNAVLRSVFNSGHRRGGSVSRFVGGRLRRFSTFVAPLAVAAIGTLPCRCFTGRSSSTCSDPAGARSSESTKATPALPSRAREFTAGRHAVRSRRTLKFRLRFAIAQRTTGASSSPSPTISGTASPREGRQ
jgi:hypothetical protein